MARILVVEDDFDQLNRQLRTDLLNNEGSRGQVLEQLFAGMDLIGETQAGKTFYAFWRLLTDIEQATIFSEALTEVIGRDFAYDPAVTNVYTEVAEVLELRAASRP